MTLQLTQDDILQNTKTITQGLEALKTEHNNLLQTLLDRLEAIKNDLNNRKIIEEEISIVKNSNEMVHLGITEATVMELAPLSCFIFIIYYAVCLCRS
jgi:kinesin light chain